MTCLRLGLSGHYMTSRRQLKGTLLDRISASATRDVIFSAVLDDLERGTPATVVFEDMHWADEATLDLLKFLGRRVSPTAQCSSSHIETKKQAPATHCAP